MSDMVGPAAAQCGILIGHIRKRMLEGGCLQVDEWRPRAGADMDRRTAARRAGAAWGAAPVKRR